MRTDEWWHEAEGYDAGRYDPGPYYPGRYDEPRPPLERLTHLVLVDGRLVDTWSEPVEGTRWEEHARRFDRERRPPLPPAPPPRPAHEEVLEWLSAVCGGPAAVAALNAAPLRDDDTDLPEVVHRPHRERLEAVAELLDSVAGTLLDVEAAIALRRALLVVWAEEPQVLTGAASAAQAAGGLCWAVGKANGWYAGTGLTQTRVAQALGLRPGISASGQRVQLALRGLLGQPLPGWGPSRWGVPDLLPLARTDVLVSGTRATLVRLRDRAEAARAALAA
jgi:hypothetical protein